MDWIYFKKKLTRTYKKDKKTFYMLLSLAIVFIMLSILTLIKIFSSGGEQEKLESNPSQNSAQNTPPIGVPVSGSSSYNITVPTIDGLSLGKIITQAEVQKEGLYIQPLRGEELYKVSRTNLSYKLYGAQGLFSFIVQSGEIVNFTFNFENIDARAFMKTIVTQHEILLDDIICQDISITEESRSINDMKNNSVNVGEPIVQTSNTPMCSLLVNVLGGVKFNVNVLPDRRSAILSFSAR